MGTRENDHKDLGWQRAYLPGQVKLRQGPGERAEPVNSGAQIAQDFVNVGTLLQEQWENG